MKVRVNIGQCPFKDGLMHSSQRKTLDPGIGWDGWMDLCGANNFKLLVLSILTFFSQI